MAMNLAIHPTGVHEEARVEHYYYYDYCYYYVCYLHYYYCYHVLLVFVMLIEFLSPSFMPDT